MTFITEVEIVTRDGSKYPILHQKFFVNKVRETSWCYSLEWSDQSIVDDLNKSTKYPDEFFVLEANMNEQKYYEFTGTFWWTKEQINWACKELSEKSIGENLRGMYLTGIKGEPHNPDIPEECWAVTNRYDPRVVRANKR